jgi:hypothetical protein
MATTLTINRQGEMTTKAKDWNQCAFTGHKNYQYKLSVKCRSKLDGYGFLIDHNRLDEAIKFIASRKSIGSCEQFGINIVNRLAKIMDEHGTDWVTIKLTVSPVVDGAPVAWMDFEKKS